MKIARALTIAGSDSGGGAGIQADLKTFAALKVHGMSAITAITAQNTTNVTAVHDVPVEVVKSQIEAVIEDIGVDAAKTGMLHTSEVIDAVTRTIEKHSIQVVVDPVMITKSGAKLLQDNAIETLRKRLIPVAALVTPNALEAEALAEMKIRNLNDAKVAAEKIAKLGPRAVIVKGGHIPSGSSVVDTLYFQGSYHEYQAEYIRKSTDHGTGCSFSAAITAELAKGRTIPEAVEVARKLITSAIRHGISIGKGHGPVNPISLLYREAERSQVLSSLTRAVGMLEENRLSYLLIPESQSNIAMSITEPESLQDVAAIAGRIVKVGRRVKASACPDFGTSRHVASAILVATHHNPAVRSAMNIAYTPVLEKVCEKLHLSVSYYDRAQEPQEVKEREGGTIPWGTEEAIRRIQRVPDVIYHAGDYGKEPMAAIFGMSATEVATTALKIAEALEAP